MRGGDWSTPCDDDIRHYDNTCVDSEKIVAISSIEDLARRSQNWSYVIETSLIYLSSQERAIFFAIYLLFYLIAVGGNIAAIIVTAKRKHRYIQKACIISLALSDLIAATALTVMSLNTFSQPLLIWTLGPFMCSFLVCIPVFGLVCSSSALVGIALDRYRNVIHALKNRWNPELHWCIAGIAAAWTVSIAVSYPMFTFFDAPQIRVIYLDTDENPLCYEETYMCISFKKHSLQIYYICLLSTVFLPLFFIFLLLYYKIARLIWKHRKPLSHLFQKKSNPSTTVETSTSQVRSTEDCSRATSNSDVNLTFVAKSRKARVQRKVRTFKIIVFLMFIFLILRLPSLMFDTVKLSYTLNHDLLWLTKYICTALTLLHCAVNPFLYVFLNETLNVCMRLVKTIKDFMCEVCCCCFSNAEFDEFENDNPFIREPFQKRIATGSNGSLPNKSNPKSSRVKFDDLPVVNLYPPERKGSSESYKDLKKY